MQHSFTTQKLHSTKCLHSVGIISCNIMTEFDAFSFYWVGGRIHKRHMLAPSRKISFYYNQVKRVQFAVQISLTAVMCGLKVLEHKHSSVLKRHFSVDTRSHCCDFKESFTEIVKTTILEQCLVFLELSHICLNCL